jgi:hypothetical protein
MTTFPFMRPSKFYPNCDFYFQNKASGNPGANQLRADNPADAAKVSPQNGTFQSSNQEQGCQIFLVAMNQNG